MPNNRQSTGRRKPPATSNQQPVTSNQQSTGRRKPPAFAFAVRRSLFALLVVILLLAAFLRFYRLDWAEYKLDEANLSRLALNMVRHGKVPLWGIGSSVGIPNAGLSVWLFAIPYAVSDNPLVATGFVAGLNVLAVAMTYALTHKVVGSKGGATAGLIAALLFAVAPWAVLNSRKIWAQDLLPPFVIAYLWTAYLAFVEKEPWWLLVHALALAACVQLHYSALALAVLSAFCVVVFWWRSWPWKILLVTLVEGLLMVSPWVYFDARRGFPNARLFLQTVLSRPSTLDASAFRMAWITLTGVDLHSLAGPQEFRNFLDSTLPVTPLFNLLGLLIILAVGWALWQGVRNWRDRQAQAGLLVALGVLFPILAFVRHSTPVFPHYFILLYPWPYVLVGMLIAGLNRHNFARPGLPSVANPGQSRGFDNPLRAFSGLSELAKHRPKRRALLGWLGGGLIVVIAAAQVYAYLSILHFVARRYTPGGYGTPVGLTLRAIHTAEQMAREINGDILVVLDSQRVNVDEVASIWDVLVDPIFAPRVINHRETMVFPATPTIYVLTEPVLADWFETILPLRPDEGYHYVIGERGVLFTELSPEDNDDLTFEFDRWANGVQLLSARSAGFMYPGDTFGWELTWRVNSPPPPGADYHWFNHLVDAEGKRVGQADGVGFSSRNWRVGDTVITSFGVPIAPEAVPGTYKMRVGMYTYPDIQNVPVVDEAGNPVSDAVEIGPIEITTGDQ